MNATTTVVLPPATTLLSDADVCRWLGDDVFDRVPASDMIRLQAAAVSVVEQLLRRTLLTTTFQLTLSSFAHGVVRACDTMDARGRRDWRLATKADAVYLLRKPLRSVEAVIYRAEGVGWRSLQDWRYTVQRGENPCILPAGGGHWPATEPGVSEAVQITYTAGYGLRDEVPVEAKNGALALMEHWLETGVDLATLSGEFPAPSFAPALRHLGHEPWRLKG